MSRIPLLFFVFGILGFISCSTTDKMKGKEVDDLYFSPQRDSSSTNTLNNSVHQHRRSNSTEVGEQREISGIFTFGFLQGGGSLIGVDMETPLSEHFGLQYGVGFFGAGGSVCYHFTPSKYLSALAFNYWHQGFGDSHVQGLMGPSFIFRPKQILNLQIGLATIVDKGPQFEEVYHKRRPDLVLIYSVGIFIPFYKSK